jgi:folate-binding protein YgfZ
MRVTEKVYHSSCGASVQFDECGKLDYKAGSVELQAGIRETALGETHRKDGAQMGVWFGCQLPDIFADWQAEYYALRQTVGLIDKNYRAYLRFSGPDRVRYLNAILTNDINGLTENHANISLFLNPQGHIQAEIETHALKDELFCVSYAMIRERLVNALDKYIIMDEVTLTDLTQEYATLALEGPKAAAAVEKVAGVRLSEFAELESRETSVQGIPCRVVRRAPGNDPNCEFLVVREQVLELWNVLLGATSTYDGKPAGYKALNTIRLEQGIPWFGYDFGEKQIPHEAGLENSHISYTKGCYTGQEIVERVRSRGQVNRVRISLQFEASEPPAPNTPLLSEGKEVGYVTRTGFSPTVHAYIGMGYARREKAAPGTVLDGAGATATVITTPIP